MPAKSRRTIGNRIAPPRFLIFLIDSLFAGIWIFASTGKWHVAVMGGFDINAVIFMLSLWPLLKDGSAASIRKHAAQNDANRSILLVIAAAIVIVLMFTIWSELSTPGKPLAALIIATLVISWLFGNLLYAFHYAHIFYRSGGNMCLSFPDTKSPDYWDFVYFAFTLGMTFQTSDVEINGREIRRVALAQCVVAFIFNIGILAFTINTLGGG
jgi:uncharacterized membrane protein